MLHSCLYERLVPFRLTRNTLSLNYLVFRIPTNRTDHYFKSIIPCYSCLWNILPDHVHCMDLKHFEAALKIYLDSLVLANIPRQHLSIISRLLGAVFFRICADVPSSVISNITIVPIYSKITELILVTVYVTGTFFLLIL